MNKIDVSDSVAIIGKAIEDSPLAHYAKHKKNQRIDVKKREQVCFIACGKVSFYRMTDDVLTISVPAPGVVGIAQLRYHSQTHYIRCDTDCEMWVIGASDAIDLFTHANLWMHAFNILSQLTQQYFERESMISRKSTREVVIQHLKFIWELPEDERSKTSVYSFILSRNHLSRSAIHKVLSELASENKITIARGKLIDARL
nr:helix-turn-helix domain-containing protein [uncultured Enterobacter sp.]